MSKLEKILLADDNEDNIELARRIFEERGYTADNGYEIIGFDCAEKLRRYYKQHEEDVPLIITDNQMKILSGLDLLREIGQKTYVVSSTPRLSERSENDPTIGRYLAARILKKDGIDVYNKIIDLAIEAGLLRDLKYEKKQA